MAGHEVQCKPDGTPTVPAPQQDDGYCEGTIRFERCCCKLYTGSFAIQVPPQTDAQAAASAAGILQSWEAAGYLVLAHSLVDSGGGWLLLLTVGWQA